MAFQRVAGSEEERELGDASDSELERTHSALEAEKVASSFRTPNYWMLAAGALLAMDSGMVNVSAMLDFGSVVSHVTGHATAIGMRLEGVRYSSRWPHAVGDGREPKRANWAINSTLTEETYYEHSMELQKALMIVSSFIFGAFLCGLIIPKNALHFGGRSFYGVALIGNSILCMAAAYFSFAEDDLVGACCAACASGLQNAMCTMHLGAVVRTTHVTGTSTDIGSTSGRAAMILLKNRCNRRNLSKLDAAELSVDLAKLGVLIILFSSFVFGCFLGSVCYNRAGTWTFVVAATPTGLLGLLYTLLRERLKRSVQAWERRRLASVKHHVHDILAQSQINHQHRVEHRHEDGYAESSSSEEGELVAGALEALEEIEACCDFSRSLSDPQINMSRGSSARGSPIAPGLSVNFRRSHS